MNLRDIKKDIDYVFSAFIEDCTTVATLRSEASAEELEALYEEAIQTYNEMRDKVVAKCGEGQSQRTRFNALSEEICEKVDALYEKLSASVKKAVAA